MPIDIDPTDFIDPDVFATVGTLNGVEVNGNFDQDYFDDVGGSVAVSGYLKTFEVATAAAPAAVTGQTLSHDGVEYTVVGIRKDGTGLFTKLILMEA